MPGKPADPCTTTLDTRGSGDSTLAMSNAPTGTEAQPRAPKKRAKPVKLSEQTINKAIREAVEGKVRTELADAGCRGLRLRLTPKGTATWVLACRDRQGFMRRYGLGNFPHLGISDARRAAGKTRQRVKEDGADPIAERKRDLMVGAAARRGEGTLKALLDAYEAKRGGDIKRWAEARRSIEVVFKPLLARPLAKLEAWDFQQLANDYKAEHAAGAAVRYARPVLKWGAENKIGAVVNAAGQLEGGVNADITKVKLPTAVRRREHVLSRDELSALLPKLGTSGSPYAAAMRFMLLTLARREEVAGATWRDVDFEAQTWTIHADRTKNSKPHVVPLSGQALALLQGRRPVDDAGNTKRTKLASLIFATTTGGPLRNWDRETKKLQVASSTTGWTRHDLRRTGATMCGDMGVLPDILEAALNHVAVHSALAATYNRSRYRPQVADALQRLADALDLIERGGGQVVRMPQRESAA